jgi:uncharacterized protein DUF6600
MDRGQNDKTVMQLSSAVHHLMLWCRRIREQPGTEAAMKMRRWNKMPVAALAVFGLSMAMVVYTNRPQAASATDAIPPNTAPTGIIAPAHVNLPPVAAEVLRMSEAGVSDDLIASYIEKSADSYALDAEQIIYLHDLGVSSAVLDVLVKHGEMAASDQTAEASSATADTGNVSPTEAPPVNGAAADFYNSLAPYGTWVDVPNYGWCWQPTVVVVDSAWQPYCNNGCWLWTDQGWYWNSYYSWGWAPFHYGRWCQYPGYGWLWCPDNVWGPAWVCWRNSPGYCGWAPLPPGACFTSGVGWTFRGLAVGFNFGFGLGSRCFTFCDFDDFCRREPFEHFRHGRDADDFFRHSRVDNDFDLDAHHRFINRGIEAATHARIGQVAVRELPHEAEHHDGFAMPDRLARNGDAQVIYRPGQDLSVVRNRFLPERDARTEHHWGGNAATHGFNGHEFGNTPPSQPVHQNGWQPSTPGVSLNHSHPNGSDQHWSGSGNSQAPPASAYHRDYSGSRQFTPPAWHPAPEGHSEPEWHSAPSWHPAPEWHSAPAWHSAPSQSWGGGAHNGGGTYSGGGEGHSGGGTHIGGGEGHSGGGMASGGGSRR